MTKHTQTRTLVGLVLLMLALGINTYMEVGNFYNEVMAWIVAGIAFLMFVLALRLPRQVSTAQLGLVFGTPFALIAIGALAGAFFG